MKSIAGIAIERGKVFIARRKAGGDLGEKWEFPGGKVEAEETDADALRREYLEEFGVTIETGPLLAYSEFTHHEQKFVLNAYRIFFTDYHFNLTEHSEWRWAALEEIEAFEFAGSDRRLFPALHAYLKAQAGINDR